MRSFKHKQQLTVWMLGAVSLLPLAAASAQSETSIQSSHGQPSAPITRESTPAQVFILAPPLILEPPRDAGSWCSTPSIMAILARNYSSPVAPALAGTITTIDPVTQTLTITLELTHTDITMPVAQLSAAEPGIQAAALKAGDNVFLLERGYATPVFGDALCRVSATTPLTLNIIGNAQQPLTLHASHIAETPTEIRLGDFATVRRFNALAPVQSGLRPEAVVITQPAQTLFTRIRTLDLLDIAIGQSVTVTQSSWSPYASQPPAVTVRVTGNHTFPR